jgi:hypothetical protein
MVSIDDSPSLCTSLTVASYTCFSSTLKSFGRDIVYGVDIRRNGRERSAEACRVGDQQHYNLADHCTIPEFLGPVQWCNLWLKHGIRDRVEIRVLLRYPMATHTDGVLRRAGQQASSHNTIHLQQTSFSGLPVHAKDALEPLLLESTRPS